MKALILLEDSSMAEDIASRINALGFEALHYRNPLKAVDNIEEISPKLVIISAVDFPRHWKPCVADIKAKPDSDAVTVILLKNQFFNADETKKANFLGINTILNEDDTVTEQIFKALASKKQTYKAQEEKHNSKEATNKSKTESPTGIVLSHPLTLKPILGTIKNASDNAIIFAPHNVQLVSDIKNGQQLYASIRIGKNINFVPCTVQEHGLSITLKY